MEFHEWLQAELARRNLTNTRFAELVGVTQTTVSRWVAGERKPTRMHAFRVARALNIDLKIMERWGYNFSNAVKPAGLSIHPGDRCYYICYKLMEKPDLIPKMEMVLHAIEE